MSDFLDAVPIVGWGDDTTWLAARRQGLGASEVAAALGLSKYRTPWQVWADKTGQMLDSFAGNDATDLGNRLEGWLLDQAMDLLNAPVSRPSERLYRHVEYPWRLASPDGVAWTRNGNELVECKTGGLINQFATEGWTEDQVPLPYELQCRWQMHVTGCRVVHVVGLVASFGLKAWRVDRDHETESSLVEAVDEWWQAHVIGGAEPRLMAGDSEVLNARWNSTVEGAAELDGGALAVIEAYNEAGEAERNAKQEKEELKAMLKSLLAEHEVGTVDGRTVVTWKHRKGDIDYEALVADLDIDPEPWRAKRGPRVLLPKRVT